MTTIMKITTQSGAVYSVDEVYRAWYKNDTPAEHLATMLSVKQEDLVAFLDEGHTNAELLAWLGNQDYSVPVVGERLYIASYDRWWLSTEIVSIEHVVE